MSDQPFYLHAAAAGDFVGQALTLGQGLPTTVKVKVGEETKEYPVSYLWKDVLIPGDYRKHATGQALALDHPGLQRMARTVKQMLANGVPIPVNVDHRDGADAARGDVIDAEVRSDGRLYLLHRLIGDDATLTALRNRVSVFIEPQFEDPKGNKYEYAIRHSALTPKPVITGQNDFQPLAASMGQRPEAPVYLHVGPDPQPSRSSDMEWLKKLRTDLGLAADVADDKLAEHIIGLRTKADTIALSQQDKAALQTQVTALTTERDTLRTQLADAQQATKPAPVTDPITLSMVASSIEVQRDAAISAGGISPAIAKELDALLVPDGKPTGIALSMTTGRRHTFGVDLYKILAGNKPVAMGEHSGAQPVARQVPGATSEQEALALSEKSGREQGEKYQQQQLAARGMK